MSDPGDSPWQVRYFDPLLYSPTNKKAGFYSDLNEFDFAAQRAKRSISPDTFGNIVFTEAIGNFWKNIPVPEISVRKEIRVKVEPQENTDSAEFSLTQSTQISGPSI